jgi:hypothetical protein
MRGLVEFAALLIAINSVQAVAEPFDRSFQLLRIGGKEVRWLPHSPGSPISLTYAIADRQLATPGALNCPNILPPSGLLRRSSLDLADFRRAATRAFARWSRSVNIDFREIADASSAAIVIGEQANPQGFAYTNLRIVAQASGRVDRIAAAQICLNPQRSWKIGFDGNLAVYDLEHTLAHEIGHAIGLDHPASRQHVMSFKYHESLASLSDGDIQGATVLYGRKTSLPADRASWPAASYHSPLPVIPTQISPLHEASASNKFESDIESARLPFLSGALKR